MTEDGAFALVGTFDAITDFVAEVLGQMYAWPRANGHSDWYGPEITTLIERMQNASSED
jgi:hypothetical protein